MEQFLTLQGEGYHTGKAAYFIRTGGCDVGCHWCDVKESWNAEAHPSISLGDLSNTLNNQPAAIVVVTGGEPMMYDMDLMTQMIRSNDRLAHVETSGAHPLSGEWDWICFSPKKFKNPHEAYYKVSHELKVVIYHPKDFEWAESHASKMHNDALLYLQPEWSRRDQIMPLIVDYIKANPKWRLSLQTHKYLDIP